MSQHTKIYINSHLEKYERLDLCTFKKDGKEYQINIRISTVKYPYRRLEAHGDIEEIDGGQYRFSCIDDLETFEIFQSELDEELFKLENIERINEEKFQQKKDS